jgi:hypothetical protein
MSIEERHAKRDAQFKEKVKALRKKNKWSEKLAKRAEKRGLKE